ncbi:MAG: imidazole glycerol phosphate synthase subunit HisH [Candidatus Bathyarchaeota archaeon]|nr:MAG: imidazole glycerol phosphate synthase subunit HisH [Candidatus Bathyarchaeota archaeon]
MTLPKISIINYGVGNLRSVRRGLERTGAEILVTHNPKEIRESDAIVLPGVGAFSTAIRDLASLSDLLKQHVEEGKPILGICLGLQLLFTQSFEGGLLEGLDLIKGDIVKLPDNVKIPQIGWNTIDIVKHHSLLEGVKDNSYFYFVHSYIPKPQDTTVIVTTTEYGTKFPSIVAKQNIFATQFHPEKSSNNGLIILNNFVKNVRR